jgi:hypothetical protein
MSDTGFKVLSMKINYLPPFKHKHKHQKLAHGFHGQASDAYAYA